MADTPRSKAIDKIAALVGTVHRSHPLRVAVDGRTASGKTTLADELADALRNQGRDVIRTSIDGFHRPRAARYARGRHSAEGYYYDARDLEAVRDLLLNPLGPGGNLQYRTASFDLDADERLDLEPLLALADGVFIVDGTFLQRPELASGWDVAIFVDVPTQVAAARGMARDEALLGGADAALALYETRYLPAFAIYEQACRPRDSADLVVDNTDFAAPVVSVQLRP